MVTFSDLTGKEPGTMTASLRNIIVFGLLMSMAPGTYAWLANMCSKAEKSLMRAPRSNRNKRRAIRIAPPMPLLETCATHVQFFLALLLWHRQCSYSDIDPNKKYTCCADGPAIINVFFFILTEIYNALKIMGEAEWRQQHWQNAVLFHEIIGPNKQQARSSTTMHRHSRFNWPGS